jgi:hypothetical protein
LLIYEQLISILQFVGLDLKSSDNQNGGGNTESSKYKKIINYRNFSRFLLLSLALIITLHLILFLFLISTGCATKGNHPELKSSITYVVLWFQLVF